MGKLNSNRAEQRDDNTTRSQDTESSTELCAKIPGPSTLPLPLMEQTASNAASETPPRLWCLIEALRSDPAMSIWVGEQLCLLGTILGRVVAFALPFPLAEIAFECASPKGGAAAVKARLKFGPRLREDSTGKCNLQACAPLQRRRTTARKTTVSAESCLPRMLRRGYNHTSSHPSHQSFPPDVPLGRPGLHLLAAYSEDSVRTVRPCGLPKPSLRSSMQTRSMHMPSWGTHRAEPGLCPTSRIKLSRRWIAGYRPLLNTSFPVRTKP